MIKIALYLERVYEYELKNNSIFWNCFLAGLIEEHLD